MLQLYLKHKVSSIFDRLSLYQIFCHFAFCKRCFDQDTVFCQMCSCVFLNYTVASVEYDFFDEIIIDNRFSEKFKAFFSPKYHMYLDIVFPYYKYIDSTQCKLFGCLYYEARTSSQQVHTTLMNILVRVYIQNIMLIYKELQGYPAITEDQLNFFQQKGILSAYGLMIVFCSCVNIEVFENIYNNFKPEKDYDSHSFKIINQHYFKYIDKKDLFFDILSGKNNVNK